jgi:hypothetical protein
LSAKKTAIPCGISRLEDKNAVKQGPREQGSQKNPAQPPEKCPKIKNGDPLWDQPFRGSKCSDCNAVFALKAKMAHKETVICFQKAGRKQMGATYGRAHTLFPV